MIGEYMSPAAMIIGERTGGVAPYLRTSTSMTASAAAGLIGPQGPVISGKPAPAPAPAPVPTFDRAFSPLENTTLSDTQKGLPATAIAAGVVALGVAGLVFYKLRKKR